MLRTIDCKLYYTILYDMVSTIYIVFAIYSMVNTICLIVYTI